jgi:murein L,D-transpeptidase YafK
LIGRIHPWLAGAVLAAVAWSLCGSAPAGPAPPTIADRVLVLKGLHTLTLYREGKAFRIYSIALGKEPVGAKHFEGDMRTPEGRYVIDFHKPDSAYHLSLHISYPSAADRAYAATRKKSAGGDIMIHGLPDEYAYLGALHRAYDWTNGCIAVTNDEIEELYAAIPNGTPIDLKP